MIRDVYNASTIPQPVNGSMLAPGGTAHHVEPDDHALALAETGDLILSQASVDDLSGDALAQRAADLDIKGRSSMSAEQLRKAVADKEKQDS